MKHARGILSVFTGLLVLADGDRQARSVLVHHRALAEAEADGFVGVGE